MKRAVLLDVSAIMYRAYFANMNFRTKNEPTGAVYGFINTLLSIIKEFNPDYMAAAFDVKRSSLKRTEIFGDYKSNRQSTPEDLVAQIPRIEEVLDAFNINRYRIESYEADDVLGSIAKKIAKDDLEVIIVTGDKDLSQLVEKNITIALLGKGTEGEKFGMLRTAEDVVNYLGVVPEKIPDLFGLIGDKSDGIPGVTKIGEKKALAIFSKYDSLEKIYENIDDLKNIEGIGPSLIKNLTNEKDIAFLSRELAKIFTNLDINLEEENLKYSMDKEKLYELCKTLEFKMFIKKLNLEEKTQTSNFDHKPVLLSLFDKVEEVEKTEKVEKEIVYEKELNINFSNRELVIIDNETLLNEQKEYLNNYKKIASIYYEELGIILSTEEKDLYFPLNHGGLLSKNIDKNTLIKFIAELDVKFISYNFKTLLNLGFTFKSMYMDMMIAYHLISSQTKMDVFIPITEYSNVDAKDFKTTFGKAHIETLLVGEFAGYLSKIGLGILAIYDEINHILHKEELYDILIQNEMPLIPVLSLMERKGIKIDVSYFKNYSLELEKELAKIEKAIYEEAGEEFNINSPKQLGDILFVKMNLPSGKKTKTGYSTDVMVLEDLESYGYNIARLLLDYRKLNKLKTTYVDTLPNLVDSNSRIHTSFNQIGTATGRLSSSEPNLQNIPVKTDDGIKIREGFVAGEGKVLMSIDYSQVELRVLTSMSKDENLIEAYREEKDLHDLTARRIFNLSDSDDVTREQRTIAKIINFSIIYGKTAFGLAKELKIPVKDASEYIKKYFEQYPRVTTFEKEVIEFGEEHGYVKTLFGRKRYISGIDSKNKTIKAQAERMAVNTVIQGTAAEVLKKVMLKVYETLKDKDDIALLLQVHDELIFEVEESSVEKYSEILADIMKNTVKLEDVNLNININIGKNWAEAK
ncbi:MULTISPECIES: DNA polymerase I [Fusobacterium]|jgi:DNA-directed DNA polymerase|uniref:DNA polymerase I n=3 Tax=Fusobacterium TaxID=848 RepID=A0AAD0HTJ3_9FUSO|nr:MULTISPECIES: DNA polymerase I [Fusobacterium]ATV35568.1 DNA polymerase I [Fusobacterium pseudoperiodonticum]ATV61538.1 DNA polymerase I [Fusobacterium pseudoperiodonticum]AVQ24660.1 DNA polymerase I [Fusobacterium periodonticum]KGE63169.1 DNA polymerase I [Fusobacterium periodonticum 2_1_31]